MMDFLARRGLGRWDGLFASIVAFGLALPVLVPYPQCGDCLNHMARLFVLTAPEGAPIHHYYEVGWRLSANLGFEMIAMPLALLFTPETVMRLVWGLTQIGLAAALWFVHRSLFARTQAPLPLAGLMLFNLPLSSGFLGFSLGLVPALFGIGLWLRWRHRLGLGRLLVFNLLAGLTLLFHVAAAAALILSVAALAAWRGRRFAPSRFAVAGTGLVLPVLLFLAMSLAHPVMSQADGANSLLYDPLGKAQMLIAPVFSGHLAADLIAALVLWGGAMLAWRRGGAGLHPALLVPLSVWLVVLLLLPRDIGNASAIDIRLAPLPALMLVAGLRMRPGRFAVYLALAAMGAVLVRTAMLLPDWSAHARKIERFRAMAAAVPMGARVLTVLPPERAGCRARSWLSFDEHIPTLLAIDRAAFVSTIFADPNMQPIRPTALAQGWAKPNIGIIKWKMVSMGEAAETDPVLAGKLPPSFWRFYPRHWRRNYDWVATIDGECTMKPPGDAGLEPVMHSPPVALYRIVQ